MEQAMNKDADRSETAIRDFGRFYTHRLGLLERGFLASDYTLTQARILYELSRRDGLVATTIAQELGLDAGYLSRILARFRADGLVEATPAEDDARRSILKLTQAGRAAFAPLDIASQHQASGMIEGLGASDRARLVRALAEIRALLDPANREPQIALRDFQVGDLGWIAHRQGTLYHHEYGFDAGFEALVAEILVAFARRPQTAGERAWIADRAGVVVGSVFLMLEENGIGRLRLLYVEPSLRGQGLGRRLVEACIDGARAAGCTRLDLWTNDILSSARRIYETAGFRCVARKPHRSFGQDLVGEDWSLDL
jgi:DNA-binding MarR family transcriptional regulator/N-acetylglutamate synthase-like GNAT family acetyltransferase